MFFSGPMSSVRAARSKCRFPYTAVNISTCSPNPYLSRFRTTAQVTHHRSAQIRTNQHKSSQIKSSQISTIHHKSNHHRSAQIRTNQHKSSQIKSSQISTIHHKSNHHRSAQISTNHHKSAQIITNQHKSSQIKSSQISTIHHKSNHHRSAQIITNHIITNHKSNHHRSSQISTDHNKSSQFFYSILSPMEFWFLAAVASGLLSWGHFISSTIIDLIAQILFKLNWAGQCHY